MAARVSPARPAPAPGPDMRHAARALLVVTAGLLGSGVTSAQRAVRVTGSVETGAAAIEQPLVRSGAAFYIAPAAQLSARGMTIGGDAVFARGTPLWQSFLANGFFRSPAIANVRVVGTGQALKTSGIPRTIHADVGAEWRGSLRAVTGVARARVGRMEFAGSLWPDAEVAGGIQREHGAMVFALDASHATATRPTALLAQLGVSELAGAAFAARTLDFTPRMIWERGRLRADASVALRAVQLGARGTTIGPQLAFTLQSARGISIFAGGVQRLPDIRSGVPAGRTALFGVRVEGRRLLSAASPRTFAAPTLHIVAGTLRLDTGPAVAERATLRGDFTEWQPRSCIRRAAHSFDCGAAPPAGTWRVSMRLDDGRWQQPANLAAAVDDFGSVDGVLMTGGKP